MSATTCKNCGSPVHEIYCGQCGQSSRTGRLDLRQLYRQLVDALADWDGRWWSTFRGLSRQPGRVVAEYVAGRRLAYVPPLRYCLLALVLGLLANQWINVDLLDQQALQTFGAAQQQVFVEVRALAAAHSDWLVWLAVPILAIQYRLLMLFRGRNLAECTVFVLYIAGHVSLFLALLTPIKLLGLAPAIGLRLLLSVLAYYLAGRVFFAVSAARAFGAAVLATLTALLVSVLGVLLLALLMRPDLLACISHTPSAAAADTLVVARAAPSCRLDVVLATPAPPLSPPHAPRRHLDHLATNG